MGEYKYGDYVTYSPVHRTSKTGRVTKQSKSGWYVCYSGGCTAANTPDDLLRPATESEIERAAKSHIGFHRFDAECKSYDEDCCFGCIHSMPEEKRQELGNDR